MLPGLLVSKKWSTDHTKRAKWKTDIGKELLYEFLQQQFDNLLYRKFLIFSLNVFYSPDIRKKTPLIYKPYLSLVDPSPSPYLTLYEGTVMFCPTGWAMCFSILPTDSTPTLTW